MYIIRAVLWPIQADLPLFINVTSLALWPSYYKCANRENMGK